MPRKRSARRHEVNLRVKNELGLTKAGTALVLDIKDGGQLLGTIEIGRGSFIWWGRSKRTGKRVAWGDFAQLMENAPGRSIRPATGKGEDR